MRYKLTVKNDLARKSFGEMEVINKKVFDWLLDGEPKHSDEYLHAINGYKVLPPIGTDLHADAIFLHASLVIVEAFENPIPEKRRGFVIEEMWAFCTVDPTDGCEGIMGGVFNGISMPLVGSDRSRYQSLIPVAKELVKVSGLKVTVKHFTLCHSHPLGEHSAFGEES